MSPHVTAVVLNFRTSDETIRTVGQLIASNDQLGQIIVVENASGDDSAKRFREELPFAELLVSDRNLGFSGGCNLGIRRALERGASHVLLLNSDVDVPADMLRRLQNGFVSGSHLGIVGPTVMRRVDRDVIESMGITWSPHTGRMTHAQAGRRFDGSFDARTVIVDGVSGCAMLIRREVFEAVGLLAEEFFFGFEDLEFCLRAKRAGFVTACVRDAKVFHEGSASIGKQSRQRTYYAARNHLLLAARVFGEQTITARALRQVSIISLNLAHALKGSEVPRLSGIAAVARGVRDYYRQRFGPPTELS